MVEVAGGLLQQALKGTALAGLNLTPQLTDRELVIELDEKQFRDMILSGADDRAKQSVTVEILQGKIRLKVRIF